MAEKSKEELAKQQRQQKIMLAILGVAGLYMGYKYFYVPMGLKIQETNRMFEEKYAKLETVRQRAAQLPRLRKEFEYMKEDLAEVAKKLPKSVNIPEVIRTVVRLMEMHGIKYSFFSPQGATARDYYTEHVFSVEAGSHLHNIAKFITDLGQLERIYSVSDLRIAKKEMTKTDPTSAKCNFTLTTYTDK